MRLTIVRMQRIRPPPARSVTDLNHSEHVFAEVARRLSSSVTFQRRGRCRIVVSSESWSLLPGVVATSPVTPGAACRTVSGSGASSGESRCVSSSCWGVGLG